jgi:poly(A) polymerase
MNNLSIPEEVLSEVGRIAAEAKIDVYAVGGYIRDKSLNIPFSGEIDFSVVGDAPSFARLVAKKLNVKSKVQIYKRFGTASFSVNSIRLEFASTRKESYNHESRNPDVSPATFEEDISRRDFTINTLAVHVNDPEKIIDLYYGLDDLHDRIIRTPLDPNRTFDDDPLRILRAIRFSARFDCKIEDSTWNAMVENRERLNIVARERINEEFYKMLAVDPPSKSLTILFESKVLEVIFPEINALAGVEQVGKHHHKDVLFHTFKVVDKVAEKSSDVNLRFAALVHDIGKPKTKRFEDGIGWTFHGHEHVGSRMIDKLRRKYSFSEELANYLSHLVFLHMRPLNLQDEGVTDSAIRRLLVQAGDNIDDLLTLCRADITSGNSQKVNRYLAEFDRMLERMDEVEMKDSMKAFHSPIRGDEIIKRTGLQQGPRVGLIKALIEEAILDGEIPNSVVGAETIFDKLYRAVTVLPEMKVLEKLREIMRARSEGVQPPPMD